MISYSVGQRTQEIGLRMALGALPADIRRSIVGEAMLLSGAGLAIGVGAALLLTRVMKSMLFEVSPVDPISFGVDDRGAGRDGAGGGVGAGAPRDAGRSRDRATRRLSNRLTSSGAAGAAPRRAS